jgi:hypothetical protein
MEVCELFSPECEPILSEVNRRATIFSGYPSRDQAMFVSGRHEVLESLQVGPSVAIKPWQSPPPSAVTRRAKPISAAERYFAGNVCVSRSHPLHDVPRCVMLPQSLTGGLRWYYSQGYGVNLVKFDIAGGVVPHPWQEL